MQVLVESCMASNVVVLRFQVVWIIEVGLIAEDKMLYPPKSKYTIHI